MSENRSTDLFVAFGVGALVGAAGALLLAPAAGEESRRRIEQLTQDTAGKAREGVESLGKTFADQGKRLKHAFEEGRAAYSKEAANVES